jgi:hemerythrin-like metal-binding protein
MRAVWDDEHAVQTRLLEAYQVALGERDDAGLADAALQLFVEYTDAHFISEQIQMREFAWSGYAAHVAEHDRMMAELRALLARHAAGAEKTDGLETAERLRRALIAHIEGPDRAFAEARAAS